MSSLATINGSVIDLLRQLIVTPSLSREENQTADLIEAFLLEKGLSPQRHLNNVFVWNRHHDAAKPTVLLNSHHDTVKPNVGWQRNPFHAGQEGDLLYRLGSKDAGGCLMAL